MDANTPDRPTTRELFRQNYFPTDWRARIDPHWMLHFPATADYLKAVLRKRRPDLGICFFWDGCAIDDLLQELIRDLGLIDEPIPQSHAEEFWCSAKYTAKMFKTQWSNT